jgi:hypothetical protein
VVACSTVCGADNPGSAGIANDAGADMDRIYSSLKITNVRTVGGPYAPGDAVVIAYEIANTSDVDLKVPVDRSYSRPYNLVGTRRHWIERQGNESTIPAIGPRIGPRLDKLMTKEEMDSTGVSGLSVAEKAALEKWVGKLVYFTTFRAYSDAARGPNQIAAREPRNVYHYHLQAAPPTLGEELAIEYARMTFAKESQKLERWELTRADFPRSNAPDGTADKYFVRFSFRPTEGRVHFTDGKRYRTVQVRLEGKWVVCWMFVGH